MCFDIQLNQVGCALQSFPMLIQTTHAPATYTHFCFVKNWAVGFLLFWPPANFSSQHGEDNAHLVRNIVTSKHCFCSQYIPRVLRKVPVHLRRFRLNLFVGWMTAVSGVTRVRFRNIFGQTLFSQKLVLTVIVLPIHADEPFIQISSMWGEVHHPLSSCKEKWTFAGKCWLHRVPSNSWALIIDTVMSGRET